MKILLIGDHGQLGWELGRSLPALGELVGVDYPQVDLSRPADLRRLVRDTAPEVIINAAAYTAVDQAESESDLAYAVNAGGPAVLAEEAKRLGAALVHYSTDYVFDGARGKPYRERDLTGPLNVYGLSKLAGEQAVQAVGGSSLILRTAWVYSLRQGGFVPKVLEWARRSPSLRVVDDQISNPTWARTLAGLTTQIVGRGRDYLDGHAGLYHCAGGGYASRYEWAKAILELDPDRGEQIAREIEPASTADFPMPAARPLFSALDCRQFEKEFGLRITPWREALRMAMQG